MAGRSLKPSTDRRLGEPLPHQLANPIWAHLLAPGLAVPGFPHRAYAVLARVSPGCPPLIGRFPNIAHPSAARQHVLLHLLPLDLHVLGTPPAFNLSHDQTLHLKLLNFKNGEKINSFTGYWLLTVDSIFSCRPTRVPTQITC